MNTKPLSMPTTSAPTSWRWHEEKQTRQQRDDRLIACGLIVCLLIQAALLATPLWN